MTGSGLMQRFRLFSGQCTPDSSLQKGFFVHKRIKRVLTGYVRFTGMKIKEIKNVYEPRLKLKLDSG